MYNRSFELNVISEILKLPISKVKEIINNIK